MLSFNLRHALLLTSLAFIPLVHASSFDCASATSKTEKTLCSDSYLSDLDEKLGARWRSTLAKVPDPKALKTDQRQWLKNRDACGSSAACLRRQYLMRLAELEHATQPFNWDATWQLIPPGTSTSATVVTQRRDATHVAFDITAGEGANSGDLSGVAILKAGEALYAEGECTLSFTPINGVLDISQVNAGDCGGGSGVYYTGRFVASEQPLALDYDMLSLGLARTAQENQTLHTLLKDDYQKLVDLSGSLMSGEPSIDVPGSQVVEMWMRGLGGTGVVMSSTDALFWVLVQTYGDQGQARLRYYTNAPEWKKRLPDVLQVWYKHRTEGGAMPLDFMP